MHTTMSEQIKIDSNQGLQLSKEIIARKNQDDTVIVMRLDESALFYKIDGIAAKVWSKMVQPITVTNIVNEIKKEYPQSEAQVEQDVLGFLGDLLKKNLIVKC